MPDRDQREALVEAIVRGERLEERFANRALVIGASCIAEFRGHIFLVVEIESTVPGARVETAVVILITREQAERLLRAGVRICTVISDISRRELGINVELLGAFIVGNHVINIFEREFRRGIRDDRDFRDDGDLRDDEDIRGLEQGFDRRECDRFGCDRLILVSTPLVPVIRE